MNRKESSVDSDMRADALKIGVNHMAEEAVLRMYEAPDGVILGADDTGEC